MSFLNPLNARPLHCLQREARMAPVMAQADLARVAVARTRPTNEDTFNKPAGTGDRNFLAGYLHKATIL